MRLGTGVRPISTRVNAGSAVPRSVVPLQGLQEHGVTEILTGVSIDTSGGGAKGLSGFGIVGQARTLGVYSLSKDQMAAMAGTLQYAWSLLGLLRFKVLNLGGLA